MVKHSRELEVFTTFGRRLQGAPGYAPPRGNPSPGLRWAGTDRAAVWFLIAKAAAPVVPSTSANGISSLSEVMDRLVPGGQTELDPPQQRLTRKPPEKTLEIFLFFPSDLKGFYTSEQSKCCYLDNTGVQSD